VAKKVQSSEFRVQSSKSNKKPQSMAQLLASRKPSFVTPHKGDIIEGKITKLTSGEVLVDINAKAEAVVLEKDKKILRNILSSLSVGDKVNVQILNPESEMGNPVVSLRGFLNNRLWAKVTELKEKREVLDVVVNEAIKGGLLVSAENGISGFLPGSQVSFASSNFEEGFSSMVGSHIKAIILEADRATNKIIFSQSQSVTTGDFRQTIKGLKIGEKITTTITNVTPYGLFVSVPIERGAIDGFIHISEISWDKITDIFSMYKTGDLIEGEIIGFDQNGRRVNLSVKKLEKDPFEEKTKNLSVDQKIAGIVKEITSGGIVFDIGNGMEALMRKGKTPLTVSYKPEDKIDLVIIEIDSKKRRILASPVLKEKPIGYR